ncbi:hypothetical protein [Metabacillus fastidiosus]|uniref:hypothetical protein n=1 Tax=Metabacillus fastidiosus TaxID=1458 RepID=UPI003D2E4839
MIKLPISEATKDRMLSHLEKVEDATNEISTILEDYEECIDNETWKKLDSLLTKLKLRRSDLQEEIDYL